jgi:hypothetical protein
MSFNLYKKKEIQCFSVYKCNNESYLFKAVFEKYRSIGRIWKFILLCPVAGLVQNVRQ